MGYQPMSLVSGHGLVARATADRLMHRNTGETPVLLL
jgi:hypothetical protein